MSASDVCQRWLPAEVSHKHSICRGSDVCCKSILQLGVERLCLTLANGGSVHGVRVPQSTIGAHQQHLVGIHQVADREGGLGPRDLQFFSQRFDHSLSDPAQHAIGWGGNDFSIGHNGKVGNAGFGRSGLPMQQGLPAGRPDRPDGSERGTGS